MWLESAIIIAFLAAMIRMATPLILATLGEIFAENSGVLNLALEGLMLMGAFTAFWAAQKTGNPWVGIIAAIVTGVILGLALAFIYVTLRLDQVVAGLASNIALIGLSAFMFRLIYGNLAFNQIKISGFGKAPIPLLSSIPILGPSFFEQNVIVYGAFILIPVAGYALYKTQFGLKVRAAGEKPEAPDNLGVSVPGVRYGCVVISGVMACLGGSFLTLAHTYLFNEGMTAGRGWIAIACVAFGRWSPYRACVGAILFGAAEALQLRVQAGGIPIPIQVLSMLPYILAVVALISLTRRVRFPTAMCIPYVRGEK